MIYPFFHKPNDPGYLHFDEFENLTGNILHLGYILNADNKLGNAEFLKLVEQTVVDKNIDLIILDCTGEPWDIEYDYRVGLSPVALRKLFTKFCKTIIITEDWRYYYDPNPNIVFFPYNLWIHSTQKIEQYYNNGKTVYKAQLTKTKPLMSLNRNLQWHRLYVLDKMAKASWLSEVDFSFVLPLGNKLEDPEVMEKLTDSEREHLSQLNLPIFLDYEKGSAINFGYNNGTSNVNTPVYNRCAVNLITETSVDETNLVTEKTTKAFSAYQIPIVIGKPGINQYLQDLGMDMFGDYIPWRSWDHEHNPRHRMEKILQFVDTIMQDTDAILNAHQQFHLRLISNHIFFHSAEFADRITKQLKRFDI